MKIDEFNINDEYVFCEKNEKILDILKKIKENRDQKKIVYVIVVDNQKPIGIISFRDIVLKLMGKQTPLGDIVAENVMSKPIITVKQGRDSSEVYKLMMGMGFRSLPVVDEEDKLVGSITISDLIEKMDKK